MTTAVPRTRQNASTGRSSVAHGAAPVPLRPARLSPQPPIAVLHPRPARPVPGDLRLGVRRQRPHRPGRRRPDRHLGVLRARHHHPRHHRRRVHQPGHLGDRPTRSRRAQAAPRDAGPGGCHHRRPSAHRRRHRARHRRRAARHRLGRLRRAHPGPHRPGARRSPSSSARSRSAASATPSRRVIHDQDAAQPVTQAVMLPLYFISGVFVAVSTSCRTGWSTSPTCSRCATSPPRCSPPTTRTPGSGFAGARPARSSPPGAPQDCSSPSADSAGCPSAVISGGGCGRRR